MVGVVDGVVAVVRVVNGVVAVVDGRRPKTTPSTTPVNTIMIANDIRRTILLFLNIETSPSLCP